MDSLTAAKYTAISTAFIISGYQAALSQNSMPILFDTAASVSTPIFKRVYNRGAVIAVPGAIIASTAFGYLAYTTRNPTHRKLFIGGAALTFSVMPFTKLIMANGIERLVQISENAAMQEKAGGEVLGLLKAWTVQNWVRSGMMFTAGIAGLLTVLV